MKAPAWARPLLTALESFALEELDWRRSIRSLASEILARLPEDSGYHSVNWTAIVGSVAYLVPLAEARGIEVEFFDDLSAHVLLRSAPVSAAA